MTVLPSPEAMIVICTVVLIAYTAHVLDKAFASSEQFEAMLKARERIMGLQAENTKLRELVRDLWEACHADGYYCIYHCEHYDKESESHCKLEDRMAELGIEVD